LFAAQEQHRTAARTPVVRAMGQPRELRRSRCRQTQALTIRIDPRVKNSTNNFAFCDLQLRSAGALEKVR
jgi:hypothetical protein